MRTLPVLLLCLVSLACLCLPALAQEENTFGLKLNFGWDEALRNYHISLEPEGMDMADAPPAAPEEVPALLDQLAPGDEQTQQKALVRLVKGGDAIVIILGKILHSEDEDRCLRAGFVLVLIGTKNAKTALRSMQVAPLLQALQGDDHEKKKFSLFLLSAVGGKEAVGTLRSLMSRPQDSETMLSILISIWFFGQKELAPDIEPCLRATDDRIRCFAAIAYLALLRDKARDKFLTLLPDPDPMVRFTLMVALSSMQTPRVTDALVTIMLFDQEPKMRAMAAMIIDGAAFPTAIRYLIQASKDADPDVRMAAAVSLGKCKASPEVLEALRALLNDPEQKVKEAAANAMTDLKSK